MKMDQHQMAEFERHWGNTFMLLENKPVFIEGLTPRNKSEAQVLCEDGETRKTVKISELEIFNPDTGYYNAVASNIPIAMFLNRYPKQQIHRGLSHRNADLTYPVLDDRHGLKFNDWTGQIYYEAKAIHAAEYGKAKGALEYLSAYKKPKPSEDKGIKVNGYAHVRVHPPTCPSVALSKNICAVKSKWGYLMLLYRKLPIGFYNEGQVFINNNASSYREQLQELNLGVIAWN